MLNWFGKRLRYMQEVKRDERGFTLIELLVVITLHPYKHFRLSGLLPN